MPPSLPSQEEAVSLVTSREKSFVHLNDISHQYYYPPPLSLNYLTFKWANVVLSPKRLFLSVHFNEGIGFFQFWGLGLHTGCILTSCQSKSLSASNPAPHSLRRTGRAVGGGETHIVRQPWIALPWGSDIPFDITCSQLDKAKTCPNKLYYAPSSDWIPV